jgi:peptidoglycan-associated lipoprotein
MRNGIAALTILVSSGFACSHQPPKANTVAMPQATAPNRVATNSAPPETTARVCSSDMDCGERQLCIRSRCVDITAGLPECSTVRIHFDFNQANIHPDETAKLQRVGRCLRSDHALHVTIEGNADERGTEDWNLALGDKRATAVENYLEQLGVSATQLRTVSYGKDRPLCSEHNEACWAENRRAALKTKAVQ